MTARTILFWLDFEATGLDVRPGRGELLEYAVVLTDLELNEIESIEGVIPQDMPWIEDILEDKAREMHEKNGLLDEIKRISTPLPKAWGGRAVKEIETELIVMLKRHLRKDPNTIFVIAGSSISYDRNALKEWMPDLEEMLHYRQLDVSVYKVGFPLIFGLETSAAHRAMSDIRESIKKHALMRALIESASMNR
jgi:oligoribonuclease